MAEPRYVQGKWQIVREIGAGGMGTVYEVVHKHSPTLRKALKQLKAEFASRSDIQKRFMKEVLLMASLHHNHIVQVHDVDTEPDFGTFIVMDLIRGSSLRQILDERGRLPYAEVLRIGCEIASALDAAHRQGVVHRDIKAGNILIETESGRAVLTDFGIAKEIRQDGEETVDGTMTDIFIGTPRYSSPEQLRSEKPHPRWDVYALGAVLYEACSGLRFLGYLKNPEVAAHVAYLPDFTPRLDFPDPPPEEFRQLIQDCIARDPEKRIPTAAELLRRLEDCRRTEALRAQDGARAPSAPPAPPAPTPPAEEATRPESYDATRAALRADTVRHLEAARALAAELAAAGLSGGEGPDIEQLDAALHGVDALEEDGFFDEAVARLDALREQAAAAQPAMERAARIALERTLGEAVARWDALRARAAGLVPAEREEAFARTRATAAEALAAGQWAVAARDVAALDAVTAGAEDDVRAAENERAALARQLALLVEETAAAPVAAVGNARTAAQAVLDRPPAPGETRAALQRALAGLTAARDAVPDYEAAATAQAAAAAAAERLGALALPRAERRPAERLMTEAAERFEQRRWAEAQGRYAQALERWTALERRAQDAETARQQAEQERYETVRGEIEATLHALDGLEDEAAGFGVDAPAAPAAASLREALGRAAELARGGAVTDALAQLDALAEQVAAARAARADGLRVAVERAAADLAARWQDLTARAGSFVDPERRAAFAELVGRVERALGGGEWAPARRGLAAGGQWLEQAERALRDQAERAVQAALAEVESGQVELGGSGEAPAVDVAALRAEIAAAIGQGRLDEAWAAAAAAQAKVAAVLDRRRQEQAERAAVLRDELERMLDGVDRRAVREAAADALERGEQAERDGRRAEEQGDSGAAAAAYETALVHYRQALERLAEQQRARIAALVEEVRALLAEAAGAPAALAGDPVRAAEALLAEPAPAADALEAAVQRLSEALAVLPAFTAASERRAEAQAAEQRLAGRKLPGRKLKPARAALARADAALAARQWDAAAEAYRSAAEAFGRLDAALERQPTAPRGPVAARAALAAALVAAAGGAVYWVTRPEVSVRETARVDVRPTAEPVREQARSVREEPQPTAVVAKATVPSMPARVPAVRIAAATPDTAAVAAKENATQTFSIDLADAPSDRPPAVEWTLAGEPIADARGKTSWQFRPGFDAAAHGPYAVAVRVGDGTAADQTRVWTVSVDDVNRAPQLAEAAPPRGQAVRKEIGQKATFRVAATDDDGDALHYAWTLDGKPAGTDAPVLDVPVAADQTVAVAITDGKGDPVRLDWRIAAVRAPLKLQPQPSTLASVRFNQAQQFKLGVPPEERQTALKYAWAVDGRTVSDAPAFTFTATDPSLIRAKPVQVSVTARDDRGREFPYQWTVKILPPAPQITAASPASERPLEVEPGATQTFTLTPAAPVGNQSLEYVFAVNGKESRSSNPRLELTTDDGREYVVVAAIEDNYKQRSGTRTWTLKPAARPAAPAAEPPALDLVRAVEGWLDDYRTALNRKDVQKISTLLGLGPDRARELEASLRKQENLRVAFTGVRIEPVGADRARASYQRVDQFTDPSGREQSLPTTVNQTFRLADGRVQLERAGR